MAGRQVLNLGTVANDGTGTPLRTGGGYLNDMTLELYGAIGKEVPIGTYILPSNVISNAAAAQSTTSYACYLPFLILEQVSVDRCGLQVGTSQATAKVHGYLYDSSNGGKPGTMIQDMGEILCNATGFRETTALGTPKVLVPGLYWGCWHVFGVNPNMSAQRVNGATGRFVGGDGVTALVNNTQPRYYNEAGIVYGTPNNNPTLTAPFGNDGVVMALRRSA